MAALHLVHRLRPDQIPLVDADKTRPHLLFHLVQLAVKDIRPGGGHTRHPAAVGTEIADALEGNAVESVSAAAEKSPVRLPLQGGGGAGEHVVQLLRLRRLEQVAQRAHSVAGIHILVIAGDKHKLQIPVHLPKTAGGIHPVHPSHLDIQKDQLQLSGPAFHPVQQALAGGELKKQPLHPPPFQGPLQRGPQGHAGFGGVVAYGNAQHGNPPFLDFPYCSTDREFRQTKFDGKAAENDGGVCRNGISALCCRIFFGSERKILLC